MLPCSEAASPAPVPIPNVLTLEDLPPPPDVRIGWPWTEAAPPPPLSLPSDSDWPRITIVTPSYNQAGFIEETIRSVLLQSYPNLEYMIFDGGSTDGSVDIIRKYEPWLTYWVSRPDGGQAAAINTGLRRATGDIASWLNSDDFYYSGALVAVARAFAASPASIAVFGRANLVAADGRIVGQALAQPYSREFMLTESNAVPQSSAFFKRQAFESSGRLDETLHYAMDHDLWLRLDRLGDFEYLPLVLSGAHIYSHAKTSSGNHGYLREVQAVVERHGGAGLPRAHREMLGSGYVPRAFEAYLRHDGEAGCRELSFAIQMDSTWSDSRRLAPLIAKYAWRLSGGFSGDDRVGIEWVNWVCRRLPDSVIEPNRVRFESLVKLYDTFRRKHGAQGQVGRAFGSLLAGARLHPRTLLRRTVWFDVFRAATRSRARPASFGLVELRQNEVERLVARSDDPNPAEMSQVILMLAFLGSLSAVSEARHSEWCHRLLGHQSTTTGLFAHSAREAHSQLEHAPSSRILGLTNSALAALAELQPSTARPLLFLQDWLSPPHLTRWITGLDWRNVVEATGQVAGWLFCLVAEYHRTQDLRYCQAAHHFLDWLDANQSSHSGGWELGHWPDHSDGLCFIGRILPLYFVMGRSVRHIHRIIDYALFAQQFTGLFSQPPDPVKDQQVIDLLVKLSLLTDYRARDIRAALGHARRALIERQPDDSQSVHCRWQWWLAVGLLQSFDPEHEPGATWWRFLSQPIAGWHDRQTILAVRGMS